MATMYKDCPVCEKRAVRNIFSHPECTNCRTTWKDYIEFRDMFIGRTPAPPPPAPAVTRVEQDDYVTSGDMQRDIEALVEDAATKARRERTGMIARHIGMLGMEGVSDGKPAQEILDEIYTFVTKLMKDEMEKMDGEMSE